MCDRATSQAVRVTWCDISDRDGQENMCVMMCYHTHDKKTGGGMVDERNVIET